MENPLFLLIAIFSAVVLIQESKANVANCVPPTTPENHLDWCASEGGLNEGAVCGARALGLPIANTPQAVLGNTYSRPVMMQAAKAAAKAGFTEQAISAAVCCQAHNPIHATCLQSHEGRVLNWLLK